MAKSANDNSPYSDLAELPWETLQPLLASDPAYLNAALVALEKKYGSVPAFMEQELGVSADMKERIKERLLEPA